MSASTMVMTTLEAAVEEERWPLLVDAYEAARSIPEPGLLESFLTQDATHPERWRIETLWRDRAALAAMRDAGTPRGVLMFRAAGVEPTLAIATVRSTIGR